ncbi:ABC transporter substrate-binding protein [Thalassoroseus pseudoceratinae]|uniref:ABC transporter substrate-binding protein n=1 Tax=Thalassoroseus pseudoceratinae TaxID=2713176 RepID=UPI0014235C66|nr:extracellular solute-binding protein [Thalassoroseus pseudoceratinae]
MRALNLKKVCWLIVGCVAVATSGCTSDDANDVTKPPELVFRDESVTIRVPADTKFAEIWDLTLAEWSGATGAETNIVTDESLQGPSQSADVLVVPLTEIPRWIEQDQLAPLPTSIRDGSALKWLDVFYGVREHTSQIAGAPRIVPVSVPILVAYYRADLLAAKNLEPPKTWTEYQKLLATLDEWAPGLTAVEPWSPEWRATTFLARAASSAKHPDQLSYEFDIRTGEPLIDSPGFQTALELVQQAHPYLDDDVVTYSPEDCRRELLAGRAAIGIALESGPNETPLPFGPKGSTSETAIERAEGIELTIEPLPGSARVYDQSKSAFQEFPEDRPHRVTLTGFAGSGVAVSKTAANSQAAWDLALQLSSKDVSQTFPPPLCSPVRESQADMPAIYAGSLLRPEEQGAWMNAVRTSLSSDQCITELPLIERDRYRKVLSLELIAMFEGDATPQEVLQRVAGEWQSITESLGQEVVRKSYRRGLGFPAP